MTDAQSILPILKQIPLFAELGEDSHQEIIKRITMELYPPSHVLFTEGTPGDKLYIIKTGMVKVSRKDLIMNADKEVATLGPNDFFGEMALITDEPRNATVTILDEAQLFVLSKSDFLKLVADVPDMANKISNEFIDRVKTNSKNKL